MKSEKSTSAKIDMVTKPSVPPKSAHKIKLQPGTSTKPLDNEKTPMEIMDEKFSFIIDMIKDVKEELATEISRSKTDRENFKTIQHNCQEKMEAMTNMYDDFKIHTMIINEDREEFKDFVQERLQQLGNSNTIGHQRIDQLEKQNKMIQQNISAQNLMLNASGSLPKNVSGFNAHSNPDLNRYPLLKTTDPKHSFDKLNTNLKGITLNGNELLAMKYACDAINLRLMVTLKSIFLIIQMSYK